MSNNAEQLPWLRIFTLMLKLWGGKKWGLSSVRKQQRWIHAVRVWNLDTYIDSDIKLPWEATGKEVNKIRGKRLIIVVTKDWISHETFVRKVILFLLTLISKVWDNFDFSETRVYSLARKWPWAGNMGSSGGWGLKWAKLCEAER